MFSRTDFLIEKTCSQCKTGFLVLDDKLSEKSAQVLCDVDKRVNKLLTQLDRLDSTQAANLRSRYNDLKIVEASKESYTINKAVGHFDKIHICLKKDGKFFDIDTIMFVVIHELTHVMRNEYDLFNAHPISFWRDNKKLLIIAESAGVMRNIDYRASPIDYCSKIINSNPVYVNI